MADYNIAMGVKPPEPINYLGQAAQMMALRAAQDDLQGNEAVKQFYAQGGDLSTPEARARLKSLSPKFGMAAEKAQFDAQKTQAEIKKLEFDNIEKAFAQSREFLNGIDYTAPDAGEKMKAWHFANHKDPYLGPLLASRGIDPAQSLASIDAAIAKGPEGIRDALRSYSMGQAKYQAELMSRERGESVARIGAGPGWAQANLAREKWKDELSNPKPTLQIIGSRVFDRNPRTGALTEVMDPTNALAPAQPPASMVNNMLADRNPTAITSLPPPVMSPQAFDTTRPPAPAAGPRPLVVPDRANDPKVQQEVSRARALGQAQAKAEQDMPGAIATGEQLLKHIDEMVGAPAVKDAQGKVIKPAGAPHPGFQGVVGATWKPGMRFVPATSEADFDARLEQVFGGAFLQAYNTLRGGGAITETEGTKGTSAMNRMRRSQSEEEFISAARDYSDVVREGIRNARAKTGAAPAAAGGGSGKVISWSDLPK